MLFNIYYTLLVNYVFKLKFVNYVEKKSYFCLVVITYHD